MCRESAVVGLKSQRICSLNASIYHPQRGVGLQEPNLGKTNHRGSLFIRSRFVLRPLSRTRFYF